MRPGSASKVPEPEVVKEILPEHLPNGKLCITVFGLGKGEAIVVRLPDGAVGVVDGCREPEPGSPEGRGDPVRELLTRLEAADTSRTAPLRLAFVCLTHPHDDHYPGLGRLLEAYEERVDEVWSVLRSIPQYAKVLPEWLEMTRGGKSNVPDRENIKGLTRVIQRLDEANKKSPGGIKHLSANKSLLNRTIDGHELEIKSCGPADGDIDDAVNELCWILASAKKSGKISRKHDPNLTSGALTVRWGSSSILLAGDLLRGKGPKSGWEYARQCITTKVQVVNVAHHASEGAHHDGLWAAMDPALAIVTPFKHGKDGNPPRPDRIALLAKSSVVALTSPPAWQDEGDSPRGLRARRGRDFKEKSRILDIVPSGMWDARRNAVAVSLDATAYSDLIRSPVPT